MEVEREKQAKSKFGQVGKSSKKTGRPSVYSEQVADRICELIENGMSVKKICEMADMPSRASIILWLKEHEEFSVKYVRAKEVYADRMHDELLEIVDDVPEDANSIAKAKLQADTRKWVLARLAPKKYGDASRLEVTGKDGGQIEVSETVRLSRLNALIALAKERGYRE